VDRYGPGDHINPPFPPYKNKNNSKTGEIKALEIHRC